MDTDDSEPIELSSPVVKDENPLKYIPDGFLLDFATQMAVVFEVEDHHRLDMKKLGLYYETYYEILDPLGWGLSLISIDRWGSRRAIPFFDHLFADMLEWLETNTEHRTPLHGIQEVALVEFKLSQEFAKPIQEWDRKLLTETIFEVRNKDDEAFWSDAKTLTAFQSIFNRRAAKR